MNFVNKLLPKKYDSRYWMIAVFIYMILAAYILGCQSLAGTYFYDPYYSDFPAHLQVTSKTWYSVYHLPVLATRHWLGYNAGAVISALIILFCDFLSIYGIRKYFSESISERYIVDFLSIAVLLVSMIIPVFWNCWYIGIGSPNPWHTPTYSAAKPFAVFSYYYFLRLYNNLKLSYSGYKKDLLMFSLFSMLSCATKPSFLLAAVPAYIIMLLFRLIKEKFIYLIDCVYIGLSLIPAGMVLLIQNLLTFQSNQVDVNHVRFGTNDVWSGAWVLTGNTITGIHFIDTVFCFGLTVFLAAGFPLLVATVQARSLRLSQKCSLLIYFFGTIIYLFVYEDGSRKYHGNFGWSYIFALLFMFIAALEGLICNPPENKNVKNACWVMFCLHLVCGLIYFVKILFGFSYR